MLDDRPAGNAGIWKVPGGGVDAGEFVAGPRSGSGFLGMGSANQAGNFNRSRFIEIQNSSSIDPAANPTIYDFEYDDAFSLSVWVKTRTPAGAAPPAPNTDDDFIFAKEDEAGENLGYYLYRSGGNFGPHGATWKVQSRQVESAQVYDTAGLAPLDDGNWHFLVATHSGGDPDGMFADSLSLYLDGSQVAEAIVNDNIGHSILSTAPLTIGSRENGSVAAVGAIDHAAIWNREITSAEVATLWQAADYDPNFVPPPIRTWVRNDSGDWFDGLNWSAGEVPNGDDTTAVFGNSIQQGPRVVFNETAATVKAVRFDTSSTAILAGAGIIMDDEDNTDARIDVLQGTHEIQMPVSFLDNGTVEAQSGTAIDFNGPISLNGKTVQTTGSGMVNINNSVDTGATGQISNSGTLGGSGTISGNLVSTGAFAVNIGGSDNGDNDDIDPMIVTGNATLDNSDIFVTLTDGFTPAPGEQFTVLQTLGTLSAINLELLGPGAASFSAPIIQASSVILQAIGGGLGVPGDYNEDGNVDAADYTIWRDNLGASNMPNRDPTPSG